MRLLFIVLLVMAGSCTSDSQRGKANSDQQKNTVLNPAAPGFNAKASDEKAIQIADEVMKAMGGRRNWDQTRFLSWNFFGARSLLWDKWEQRVRIESPQDSTVYLIDLARDTGKVYKSGKLLQQRDSIDKYVSAGKSIWINDSYWLVMPFKLKDSGLRLNYIGTDTTIAGQPADLLQLTFDGVGDTPQNKYLVYVDQSSKLVTQWDFFRNAEDAKPAFSTPWQNYRRYGEILLSGDRGKRKLTDIKVLQDVPEAVFSTLDGSIRSLK